MVLASVKKNGGVKHVREKSAFTGCGETIMVVVAHANWDGVVLGATQRACVYLEHVQTVDTAKSLHDQLVRLDLIVYARRSLQVPHASRLCVQIYAVGMALVTRKCFDVIVRLSTMVYCVDKKQVFERRKMS